MNADICILGGGLAGLLSALTLQNKGLKILVLEKERKVGGLLRTVTIDNFSFDMGGSHVIFSKNDKILNLMLTLIPGGAKKHYRNSKIYYKGRFIKYPFENGLNELDLYERYECLIDFIKALINKYKGVSKEPQNFKEWCYTTFGRSICTKYMIPYNEKIWKLQLDELSVDWVKDRVPNPPVEDIIKSAIGIPTEGYTHQLTFYYPHRGGIEALIKGIKQSLEHNVSIITKFNVSNLFKEDSKFIVKAGKKECVCNEVISTIPLPELLKILIRSEVPKIISKLVNKLRYVSLVVFGIGGKTKKKFNYHWVYFPQKEVVFHRLAFLSNYSNSMAPKNKVSLIAEVSIPSNLIKKINTRELYEQVVEGLSNVGVINKNDIEVSTHCTWKYAYIVYDHNYKFVTRIIKIFLKEYGIKLVGRFSTWSYLNMDHVFENVITTLGFPKIVK